MKKPLSYTPKKPLIYPPKKPLPDTVKKPLAYTLSATLLMASLTACGNQADDAVSTDKSQQLSAEQAVYAPYTPLKVKISKSTPPNSPKKNSLAIVTLPTTRYGEIQT